MPHTDISVADLLTAVKALSADPGEIASIAGLLRLDRPAGILAARVSGGYDPRLAPPRPRAAQATPAPTAVAPTTPPPQPGLSGVVLGTVLQQVQTEGAALPPPWAHSVRPMPAPAHRPAEAPREPLFAKRQTRGILAASLATRSRSGPVHVPQVIELLSALRPLTIIPRLPVPTLRRGVQLLVDRATAMDPFRPDQDYLVGSIGRLVGESRVQLLWFVGFPEEVADAGRGGESRRWTPPPHGTPVVLVTDLGIGGPLINRDRPDRVRWLSLARRARLAGCPVVAFVPFPPRRWDPAVARAMMVVHWDRRTTAGAVRRAVGPGHEVA